MPLSGALRRRDTTPRRIACSSAMAGGLFFLCLPTYSSFTRPGRSANGSISNCWRTVARHCSKRSPRLINSTLTPLLPFTHTACHNIDRELTSRAAFAGNLRAILLVDNGTAFCSSATGKFSRQLNVIAPHSDISRDTDLQLMPGTPLQPNKPVLALWIKNPGSLQSGVLTLNITLSAPYQLLASRRPEITGMALMAQRSALTSWQSGLIENKNLPTPLHQQALTGYPLQFVVYGSTLAVSDYQTILLVACCCRCCLQGDGGYCCRCISVPAES